jgi:hypothetical protein
MNLKKALLTVVSLVVFIAAGCSQPGSNTRNGATDIGVWSIDVEVVGQAPIKFTNEDAEKIGPVQIKAAQKNGDTFLEENTYTGILINDFLDYLGVDGFSVISVEASDGYSNEFAPADISEDGMGLSWAKDSKMLDGESGPILLVNHERGPKHWIKQVSKVTIIK